MRAIAEPHVASWRAAYRGIVGAARLPTVHLRVPLLRRSSQVRE